MAYSHEKWKEYFLQNKSAPEGVMPSSTAAELGIDPKYQDLLDANPYRNYNYHQSGWDSLAEQFGFRSGRQKYIDNLLLQANEYDSQIVLKAQQEAYDSAAGQAARMREAGLNPDLQGVTAGGSSGVEPDNNAMEIPDGNDGMHNIAGIASTCLQAFTMAQEILKGTEALRAARLANDGKDMENIATLWKVAKDRVDNSADRDFRDSREPATDINGVMTTNYEDAFRNQHIPKKYRKLYSEFYSGYRNSVQFQKDLESNIGVLNRNVKQNAIEENAFFEDQRKIFKGVNHILLEYGKSSILWGAQAENQEAMNRNTLAVGAAERQIAYEEGRNALQGAQTENVKANTWSQELQNGFERANKKIIDYLTREMDKGSDFAGAMLFGFNLLRGMSGSVGKGPKGFTGSIGF